MVSDDNGWSTATIGEVAAVFDGPHATPKRTEVGPVFLGISCLDNGRLDLSSTAHLSERDFKKWTRRVVPQAGDIVFSYETRIGEAALVPQGLRCCLGRRMALVRPKPDSLDSRFFLYQYLSPSFQRFLKSRTNPGSTVNRILLTEFGSFPIALPPLPEQRAIARILGALDDKIELNREMNRTLEAMAQAIFKSWFVDFDPVTAKAAGQKPFGMDVATAALFPDRFVDSELGPIPERWKPSTLGKISENPRRGVRPQAIDGATPYVGLEHVPRQQLTLYEWGRAEDVTSAKSQFRTGEILFGKLRPYFHKVAVAPMEGICSTDILVVRPKADIWFGLVVGHASSKELVGWADSSSSGTRQPRTSWKALERFEIVLPEPKVASRFNELLVPLLNQAQHNIDESRTLAKLRDALLPKLLSGEIRVGSVERTVLEGETSEMA